ncbi:MAG TPA: RNA polymerase sigma factor [Acidimicrobiales bacterium]|jgi:RNA polymerase sigma-70 factor (ECF subfamily)|nr:RNA polymerase sigma factor [Acidimicrobiales bacterium]
MTAPDGGDDALVDAARDGDRDALDALLRRHYDRIYALCRRMTGNDADALDATQDALIAIVRGLPRFRAGARFSTWAYRVATNACLDELRRRRRRPEPGLPDLDRTRSASTSASAADVDARVDIDRALASVAAEFRAPVVLRDLCGLDYAEIAEVLDVPVGTVKSRIARGRAALADLLGNPAPAPDRPTPAT